MTRPSTHVAVIDIGKTNAKLALVDTGTLTEIAVRRRPNTVLAGPPYPHYDLDGLWEFMLDALAELHADHRIDAISVTTHGASAVLLDADGGLAAPMLDYEHPGPDDLAADYDGLRPDFEATGSPRLPMGLNLGAQLHWQLATMEGLRARLATVVTYPQYWSGRLTGEYRTEVTSLGCHTDLWEPRGNRFSALVARLGLEECMAPVAKAGDHLGPILPAIAARTGLSPDTPVVCGIHDSNASLYPHILARPRPFSVVSTGTWVICMALGGRETRLDPARDTLINVAATGEPVPSGRFMGGREYSTLLGSDPAIPTEDELAAVIGARAMLLPGIETGSGPYPGRTASWLNTPDDISAGTKAAVVSLYLSMMTATCLDLIGAEGPIAVEGPLGTNTAFLHMLTVATGRPATAAGGSTGTSIGAALLVDGAGQGAETPPAPPQTAPEGWAAYAEAWRAAMAAG